MSGYVLFVGTTQNASRIRPLFSDDEIEEISLANGYTLVYVSNSGTTDAGTVFQGYGIDHFSERMVFPGAPSDQLPLPTAPIEGSYFTARYDANSVNCGADVFGHVSMVWFHDPALFAVSDSFHTLIAMRRALDLSLTLDEDTVAARSWLNSMALSQLGPETYCKEINFGTPGTSFTFDLQTGSLREEPLELQKFYENSFEDHAHAISLTHERMIRTIKTYAQTGASVSLALSGGLDSRLCLAAALEADIGESLHVACNNNGTKDYAVAVELSEIFGFSLNQPRPEIQGKLILNDAYAGWACGSMGLYDALYMPKYFRLQQIPVFAMGGQGAEMSKGNFGWRRLDAISMPPRALEQSRRALERLGIDPDHKWGSEWHYLAHRSALHSGRSILSNEYVARPTAQIPLIGLSRSKNNELPAPKTTEPNVIFYALIKTNPRLAIHRFDDARKNHSASLINERLNRVGGLTDPAVLTPYTVTGMASPSKGILKSHIKIAQDSGFTGELSAANMIPAAQEAFSRCESILSSAVRDCFLNIDTMDQSRLNGSSRQAGVLGQLVGIHGVL